MAACQHCGGGLMYVPGFGPGGGVRICEDCGASPDVDEWGPMRHPYRTAEGGA